MFERLVYGVSDKRGEELAELYAEETHVTHPFQPGSAVVRTRDELRAHFEQAAGMGSTSRRPTWSPTRPRIPRC